MEIVKEPTPKKVTVFDHLPVNDVLKIICARIMKKHKCFLGLYRVELEDQIQDTVVKLLGANFNPLKSKPSTFITMATDCLVWTKRARITSASRTPPEGLNEIEYKDSNPLEFQKIHRKYDNTWK